MTIRIENKLQDQSGIERMPIDWNNAGEAGRSAVAENATEAVFVCEEGESDKPVPIPGLIRTRHRTTHWQADVGYTNAEKRPSTSFEIDRRSVDQGWTEEDGSAFQMPGLLVSPAASVTSKVDLLGGERTGPVKGLCATCAHALSCTFPRSESGIWRCEEYS